MTEDDQESDQVSIVSAHLTAPTREELRSGLARLLSEVAKIPIEQITDTASIDEDFRMESVAFVELQVAMEEEYQIEIDPIRVLELNQFGLIVEYVYKQLTNGVG